MSTNGQTGIPSPEQIIQLLSAPMPADENLDPEHLWGSLAVADMFLLVFSLTMGSEDKKSISGLAAKLTGDIGAVAREEHARKGAVPRRFIGMLETLDDIRRHFSG